MINKLYTCYLLRFSQIVDDSMDMLMIQSKQQATMEQQLQKTMKQLDDLTGEKNSLESETMELRETVEKQQKAMRDLKTQYDALLKAKDVSFALCVRCIFLHD